MLGRGVAPVVEAEPSGTEEVRWIIRGSDVALGNLESSLTPCTHFGQRPSQNRLPDRHGRK